jgi:hypothetical protein
MRRAFGTFLYYLTAIVAGSILLAMTSAFEMRMRGESIESEVPFFSLVAIIPGLLSALPFWIGAFILRRLARRFAWNSVWVWLAVGIPLMLGAFWALSKLGFLLERTYFSMKWMAVKTAVMMLLVGPMMTATKPWWLPIPSALLTILLLYLIHRALGAGKSPARKPPRAARAAS